MDIQITPWGQDAYVISCPHEMEWGARSNLVEVIQSAASGKALTGIIVDLDRVTYINSAGLGAIFALRKYAKEAGAEIVVARPIATVNRLLETVMLPKLIPVLETLDEAKAKLTELTQGADA